jgi:hypothetical protein
MNAKDKTYIVAIQEVHVQHIKVSAGSQEEAIEKASDGKGDYQHLEYKHTLSRDTWTVEEAEEGGRTYQ